MNIFKDMFKLKVPGPPPEMPESMQNKNKMKQIVIVSYEYEVVGESQKEIDFLISQLDRDPSLTMVSGGDYKATYTGKKTVYKKKIKE